VGAREKQWLEIFQQGWGANGVWTPEYVQSLADSVSLTCMRNENLTPYLKLKPLPKVVIELLSATIDFIPGKNLYWRSVIGGQALQLCLAHEMVTYRFLVFEKRSV
jgi:hypothetical protein